MPLPQVKPVELSGILNSSAATNSNSADSSAGSRLAAISSPPSKGIVGRIISTAGAVLKDPKNDNQILRQVKADSKNLVSLMGKVVGLLFNIQRTLSAQLSLQDLEFRQVEHERREEALTRHVEPTVEKSEKAVEQKKEHPGLIKSLIGDILEGLGAAGLIGGAAATAEVAGGAAAAAGGVEAVGAGVGAAAEAVGAAGTTAAGIGQSLAIGGAAAGVAGLAYKTYKGLFPGAKSRKTREQQIYQLLREHGLSHSSAIAFMSEIGRENAFKDKFLFGTHTDSNNHLTNIGMFSWQGDRAKGLTKLLQSRGLMKDGKMVRSQAALETQVEYALDEMKTGKGGGTKKDKQAYENFYNNRGKELPVGVTNEALRRFIRYDTKAPNALKNREYFRAESEQSVAELKAGVNRQTPSKNDSYQFKEPKIGYKRIAGGHVVAYDKLTGHVIEALPGNDPAWARRRNELIKQREQKKDEKVAPVVIHNSSSTGATPGVTTNSRTVPSPGKSNIDLYHLYFGTTYK